MSALRICLNSLLSPLRYAVDAFTAESDRIVEDRLGRLARRQEARRRDMERRMQRRRRLEVRVMEKMCRRV